MQAVQGTSQSKTELLSFSLFLLCFLCFSLSPSTQIIPSISLSSSSKGVGFPVSCSCLPPVPRNPHLPRHIETETPRRAVDTLSAETVHQLLCHHRCLCAGTISFSRKGSCRQTCACCGRGAEGGRCVQPSSTVGKGMGWGLSLSFPRLSWSSGDTCPAEASSLASFKTGEHSQPSVLSPQRVTKELSC